MTTVGHILAGAAVWIAGRSRPDSQNRAARAADRALLGACMLCASVPDLDLLAGALSGRYLHRGATHSIVFCLLVGLVAAALMLKIFPALERRRIFALCIAAALSHLVIDYFAADTFAPFGIPLFWPFSTRYFISPRVLFPTSMRGSVALVFSVHNLVALTVELCVGGLACLMAAVLRPLREGRAG